MQRVCNCGALWKKVKIFDKEPMQKNDRHIHILGAGSAGLAVGYYAKKKGLPFTIYEASNRIGGNAITLKYGDFRLDSGAHRFHDRNRETTSHINRRCQDIAKGTVLFRIYNRIKCTVLLRILQ